MVYTHVAAAILSAALASWGTWQLQSWRYNATIATLKQGYAQNLQKAEELARKREQSLSVYRQQAEEKYVQEKTRAAAAASRARNELDGLRNELYALGPSSARKGPAATGRADGPARLEGELLGQCATALVGVAAEADRLAASVVGLQAYVKNVCVGAP